MLNNKIYGILIVVIATLLMALSVPPPTQAVTDNLITTNPGFESGGLNGWTADGSESWQASPKSHSGDYSAWCAPSWSPCGSLTTKKYDITAGNVIDFSIWIRGSSGGGSVKLRPVWTLSGGSTYSDPDSVKVTMANSWQQLEVVEIAPTNATKFQLQVIPTQGTENDFYVDDASVIDYSPDETDPIMNGDLNDDASPPSASEGDISSCQNTTWLKGTSKQPKLCLNTFLRSDDKTGGKKNSESFAPWMWAVVEKWNGSSYVFLTSGHTYDYSGGSNWKYKGVAGINVLKNAKYRVTVAQMGWMPPTTLQNGWSLVSSNAIQKVYTFKSNYQHDSVGFKHRQNSGDPDARFGVTTYPNGGGGLSVNAPRSRYGLGSADATIRVQTMKFCDEAGGGSPCMNRTDGSEAISPSGASLQSYVSQFDYDTVFVLGNEVNCTGYTGDSWDSTNHTACTGPNKYARLYKLFWDTIKSTTANGEAVGQRYQVTFSPLMQEVGNNYGPSAYFTDFVDDYLAQYGIKPGVDMFPIHYYAISGSVPGPTYCNNNTTAVNSAINSNNYTTGAALTNTYVSNNTNGISGQISWYQGAFSNYYSKAPALPHEWGWIVNFNDTDDGLIEQPNPHILFNGADDLSNGWHSCIADANRQITDWMINNYNGLGIVAWLNFYGKFQDFDTCWNYPYTPGSPPNWPCFSGFFWDSNGETTQVGTHYINNAKGLPW